MFKCLLVPLDGSHFASKALRYATEIATHFGSEVILLQVIKPAAPVTSAPGNASPRAAEIALLAAEEEDRRNATGARRYLSGKVRGIRSRNIKASYQVVVGDPATSIIEFSKNKQMDLVVMTTHGKSGLKRAIMGSVADTVVRESGKPVLVIRPHTSSKR